MPQISLAVLLIYLALGKTFSWKHISIATAVSITNLLSQLVTVQLLSVILLCSFEASTVMSNGYLSLLVEDLYKQKAKHFKKLLSSNSVILLFGYKAWYLAQQS